MGVRCARACSATMLVSAEEWKSRIWRGGEETQRRDYRATEAKVARRLHSWRRFEEWRRHCRPPTHDSSQPYAITWQWVHVAHAHLDLSPAWHGQSPTARERHGYRQFETSLAAKQQFQLAAAITASQNAASDALRITQRN